MQLNQSVEQGDGLIVAFGSLQTFGETELPVERFGLHQDRLAVGRFGRVVELLVEVAIAEQSI